MEKTRFYVTYLVAVSVDATDSTDAQATLFRKLRRFAKRVSADGLYQVEPQYVEEQKTGNLIDVR